MVKACLVGSSRYPVHAGGSVSPNRVERHPPSTPCRFIPALPHPLAALPIASQPHGWRRSSSHLRYPKVTDPTPRRRRCAPNATSPTPSPPSGLNSPAPWRGGCHDVHAARNLSHSKTRPLFADGEQSVDHAHVRVGAGPEKYGIVIVCEDDFREEIVPLTTGGSLRAMLPVSVRNSGPPVESGLAIYNPDQWLLRSRSSQYA